MLSEKQKKQYSKFLSLVLRHQPDLIELNLDAEGWVLIDELIEKAKRKDLHYTREIIEQIVQENDKQRFAIEGNKIRANQGHSISIDLNLPPQMPPPFLFHGTASRFLKDIMREGLSKRNRQHVHLSQDIETAHKVGERHGLPIILQIDTRKMAADGYTFYLSENGVWLTDTVPAKYISRFK